MSDADEFDDYEEWGEDSCYECGGEGFVSLCFEEWACVDPDYGCDLCTYRCDVCRPRKPNPEFYIPRTPQGDRSPQGGNGVAGAVHESAGPAKQDAPK